MTGNELLHLQAVLYGLPVAQVNHAPTSCSNVSA